MKTKHEIFTEALEKMPYKFTGNSFSKVCLRLGIGVGNIKNGENSRFLQLNAVRTGGRTWRKRNDGEIPHDEMQKIDNGMTMSVYEMIQALKEQGYKILKPTWEEV